MYFFILFFLTEGAFEPGEGIRFSCPLPALQNHRALSVLPPPPRRRMTSALLGAGGPTQITLTDQERYCKEYFWNRAPHSSESPAS